MIDPCAVFSYHFFWPRYNIYNLQQLILVISQHLWPETAPVIAPYRELLDTHIFLCGIEGATKIQLMSVLPSVNPLLCEQAWESRLQLLKFH